MKDPKWFRELRAKFEYQQAHAFLLHGNTADYVAGAGAIDLETFLAGRLANRVVCIYDVARGFVFPHGESHKREFVRRTGLAEQPEQNGAMAALQAAGGGPQGDDADLPRGPAQALPLIEEFLTADVSDDEALPAVVLLNLEAIVPNAPWAQLSPAERETIVRLQRWGRDFAGMAGAIVIGIVRNVQDLHESLRSAANRWEAIEVPIPDEPARLAFWETLAQRDGFTLADDISLEQLARTTAGLGLMHLEDIALRATVNGEPISLEMVRERKRDIISAEYGDVIELVDPVADFSKVGGKGYLKEWFTNSVIRPLREGNARRIPKGVLMLGPAGTGKSWFAEAVAGEAGVNFVKLNLSRIYGKYVGDSEKNLEKALAMITALAPTLVFIDEIDQTFQRGQGGDSGVSQRLFKRVMEVMADTSLRGKVVWLAASNRPDMIDAALKRAGRFDKKVAFLAPDEEERAAIIDVMCDRYEAETALSDDTLASVVAQTDGWTGAELELLVVKAIEIAEDSAEDWREAVVTDLALAGALQKIRRNTADVDLMTRLALREIDDLDLLPPAYREQAKDVETLDEEIDELRQREPARTGRREL